MNEITNNPNQTLYFSHGFSPVFKDLTKVDVPTDIDVILVAPKGSGRTVRSLFREGRGINSSIAVYQDVTGKAQEKAVALGVAVGSGYLYQTTFEKEVWSDLYGERGCLMGGIHGMFLAQYEVLRERGHSPSEAFNETVEEATQSLYPLIGANGMDYMYDACSTTARRGALDWSTRFKENLKPLFSELYDSVRDGTETQKALDFNSRKDYKEALDKELAQIRGMEIWRAGKAVRFVLHELNLTTFLLTHFYQVPPSRECSVSSDQRVCIIFIQKQLKGVLFQRASISRPQLYVGWRVLVHMSDIGGTEHLAKRSESVSFMCSSSSPSSYIPIQLTSDICNDSR